VDEVSLLREAVALLALGVALLAVAFEDERVLPPR
jgi:hypothetical protein